MYTHAACLIQSFPYVLPSTPHTGMYSCEHTTGHFPFEANATPLQNIEN